jgi:GMP synthase-like glutamine amidotransferase/GNAT superfamily N-acetyltransferase
MTDPLADLRLRPVVASDLGALAALYAHAARTLGPQVYTPRQVAAWVSFAHDTPAFGHYVLDADTWLAEDGNARVLGFCGFSLTGTRRDEAEVHSLYVHPDAGRRGLGSRLLGDAIERARAAGARRFHAWATPFSRPLFERAGLPLLEAVQGPFAGEMFERYRMSGDGQGAGEWRVRAEPTTARRIAILTTFEGELPFLARHPDDGAKVAAGLEPWRPGWHFERFAVSAGEWPQDPGAFDGIVITGSPASVNERRPWIAALGQFVRDAFDADLPLVGLCFGHQMIAAALGGRVAKSAAGLRLGTATTPITRAMPWMTPPAPALTLYAAHDEQVVELPPGAQVIGGDPACPVGAFAIGDRAFALQCHPEFGFGFMRDLVDAWAPRLAPAAAERARAQVAQAVDSALAMRWIAQFFDAPRRSSIPG